MSLSSSGTISFVALAIGVLMVLASHLLSSQSKGGIHNLTGIPILAAWDFYTKRYDFLRKHFDSGKKYFQFHILQHRVIALSGEDARKLFFSEQGLDLDDGYRLLQGGIPSLGDIDVKDGEVKLDTDFMKRLLLLLHKDRISNVLPVLLDDINRKMKYWGKEGTIDPFQDVYGLAVQMTVRMATCEELAKNQEDIKHLMQHYQDIDESATPVNVLLPWFPSQARKAQGKATRALFTLLQKYVDLRRKAAVPSSDPIDTLMAHGDTDESIVGASMGIIFAGVINTGRNMCWVLLNLGANPEWKVKVANELKALVANHTNTLSQDPFHKRLAAVPLNAWEEELPMLDLVIRETLRITMCFAVLRRNLGRGIPLAGSTINRGDFVTYSLADVHMNPNIYTNPGKFDPGRFMKGKEEDKKAPFAYAAWGAGRHPCPGMRFAKLEIKFVLALFLVGYEFELVDGNGKFPREFPTVDRNDLHQLSAVGETCYLKFKRLIE